MPDLNDFYAFKTTTSSSGSGGGKSNNSNNGNSGSNGCGTPLIMLAIIGWLLWFIGRLLT